jgi:hypothetical protein
VAARLNPSPTLERESHARDPSPVSDHYDTLMHLIWVSGHDDLVVLSASLDKGTCLLGGDAHVPSPIGRSQQADVEHGPVGGGQAVTIDHGGWLSDFGATGSVDGGITGAEIPHRFPSASLGIDSRYLYVHFPLTNLANDETGVGSFRQKSRSLASTSDMIRDIDDTSSKPESSTVAEVAQAPLKQIATVSTQIPNVLLAGQDFTGWTNADLLGAYRGAIDAHIVSEVDGAGIAAASVGDAENVYEAVLYAQEQVRSAGYAPDMLALSPADALALQLLMLTGGDHYAFATPAPQFVVSPSIEGGFGFVCDTASLGRLFLSPFRFEVFEENAGSTNSSTVRAESNGLFVVQRPDAAAYIIAGGS